MDPSSAQVLAEHWPLVGVLVAGGLALGALIRGVFGVFFWSEKRVEGLLQKAIDMLLASAAFASAVERISEAFTARVEEQIRDLRVRDEERAGAVGRAHSRIDELQQRTSDQLLDLAKRLPGDAR